MRQFSLCCLILLISGTSFSQTDNLYQYNLEDGLPSSYTKQVTQLPDGELLIASDNGLVFFDGYNFTSYSILNGLPSIYVKYSLIDNDGVLWVGTDGGLAKKDLKSPKWEFEKVIIDPADPTTKAVRLFLDSKNRLWVATQKNVYVRINGELKHTPYNHDFEMAQDYVRAASFAEDKNGNIWVTTLGGGLFIFNENKFGLERLNHPSFPLVPRVMHLLPDGSFLVGAADGIYQVLVNIQNVSESIARQLTASIRVVDVIRPINEKEFLIATDGWGTLIFNMQTGSLKPFVSLTTNYIKDIFIDKQKNVWITGDDGLYLKPYSFFDNITEESGLPKRYVSKVVSDKNGNVWIGTYEGVFKKGRNAQRVGKVSGFKEELFVRNLLYEPDQNQVFVFERKEIFIIDLPSENVRKFADIPIELEVDEVFLDSQKRIWIATQKELVAFDLKSKQWKNYGLIENKNSIRGISQTLDGSIWVSGEGGKLYVQALGGSDFSVFNFNSVPNNWNDKTLVELMSSDMFNQVWVGGTDGLFVLKTDKIIYQIQGEPGFPIDNIRFIVPQQKRIWVGTNRFLVLLLLDDQGNVVAKRFFNKKNGLHSTSFSFRAGFNDQFNQVWMGTNLGVGFYNGMPISESMPGVKIANWKTDDKQIFLDTDFKELSASVSSIQFEYYGIDFPADDIYYQTRIPEISPIWSDPTKNRTFNFPINAYGEYSFEVRATKQIGTWSEPVSVSFEVLPPLYRRWWAVTIYIILGGLFIFWFIRSRAKALEEKNLILEKEIATRTEDIVRKDAHLKNILHEMEDQGAKLFVESGKLNENLNSITASTVQQSTAVNQTSAMMEEVAQSNRLIENSVNMLNEMINRAQQAVDNVSQLSKENSVQIHRVQENYDQQVKLMQNLADAVESLKKVSLFIESVNDQTQLIAFNAAIEATMSGDAGRRFGVIADEIRGLSKEINHSTKEIKTTLNNMVDEVKEAVKFSKQNRKVIQETVHVNHKMEEAFVMVLSASEEAYNAIAKIQNSTAQQTEANSQMVMSLKDIAESSHSTVQSIKEIQEISSKMESMAAIFSGKR